MDSKRFKVDRILTLACEGEEFAVPLSILCKYSKVLEKAFTGPYPEASTGVMSVTQFDAKTLRRMLEFMYEGKYDASTPGKLKDSGYNGHSDIDKPASPVAELEDKIAAVGICEVSSTEDEPHSMLDELRPHILVNSIGDYYDVPGLKQEANEHISDILRNAWSSSDIAAAVELAFASTSDTELCTIMTTAVADHITELIDREDFIGHEILNDFSVGIMKDLFKKLMASVHEVEESKYKIQDLENEVEQQEYSCKRKVSGLQETVEKMENAIDIINTRQNCRHCDKAWYCYIESNSQYRVRCAGCRTRH